MRPASDPELKAALDKGWACVAGLVARLLALGLIATRLEIGWNYAGLRPALGLSPETRREARRLLCVAEALARRLIGIMALQLTPYRASLSHGSRSGLQARLRSLEPGPSRREAARGSTGKTPAFALFEKIVSPGSFLGETGPGQRRVPSILRRETRKAQRPPALLRRVAALQGVVLHPRRAATRLAKYLSRQTALKPHNLRPGAPPGFVRSRHEEAARVDDLGARLRALARARGSPVRLLHLQDAPARKGGMAVLGFPSPRGEGQG